MGRKPGGRRSRLTLHHQQTVLAAKGAKRVHLVCKEDAENATIVSCANAVGHAILPSMDKEVFRVYEAYWDDELLKNWDKYPACNLNRNRFSDVFLPTWKETMTISHITSGFRATGICPFDKDVPPVEEVDSDYAANYYPP
ncbi:hypothetical protein Trydic_g1445 [Trypoxylus dichotomus]